MVWLSESGTVFSDASFKGFLARMDAITSTAPAPLSTPVISNTIGQQATPVNTSDTRERTLTYPDTVSNAADTPKLSKNDLEFLQKEGIDPDDIVLLPSSSKLSQQTNTSASADINAAVWLGSFMGVTNAVIAADVIAAEGQALQFRLGDQQFEYSGDYTVMLYMPRKHANPYFGLGSFEKAKLVILENVGGNTVPLPDATIYDRTSHFIDTAAMGKEWIYSGVYTINN